jgi:hypothetical protein
MTPFVKIERSVATSMEQRLVLLQQPCEFFRPFFGGRIPTLSEKVLYVEQAVQRMTSVHIFENDTYHVEINYTPPYINLDIKRHDGCSHKNWREFQQIKNELVGPEHEAVELFPAESRLVDTANQYHLWVHVSADFRFPFGFGSRCVLDKPVTYDRVTQPSDSAFQPAALPADRVA